MKMVRTAARITSQEWYPKKFARKKRGAAGAEAEVDTATGDDVAEEMDAASIVEEIQAVIDDVDGRSTNRDISMREATAVSKIRIRDLSKCTRRSVGSPSPLKVEDTQRMISPSRTRSRHLSRLNALETSNVVDPIDTVECAKSIRSVPQLRIWDSNEEKWRTK